jgi:hypothetical protein
VSASHDLLIIVSSVVCRLWTGVGSGINEPKVLVGRQSARPAGVFQLHILEDQLGYESEGP